jgi:hypothetical protein
MSRQALRSKSRYSACFQPTPAFLACMSNSMLENKPVCRDAFCPFENQFRSCPLGHRPIPGTQNPSLGHKPVWRELTFTAPPVHVG